MHIDINSIGANTVLVAFNGELAGQVIEADTTEGYIVRAEYGYDHKSSDLPGIVRETGRKVKMNGRVDFIGDSLKDSPKVLYERLNKIRTELGLGAYPASPFMDDDAS